MGSICDDLVDLPTPWMVDLYGIHVGKYTIAQMDPMRNKFMNMMKFAKN